jgi:hypothetical protein
MLLAASLFTHAHTIDRALNKRCYQHAGLAYFGKLETGGI